MYGVWLAGVLAAATAQACGTEPIRVGMTLDEVEAAIGRRISLFTIVDTWGIRGDGPAFAMCREVDGLGGVKERLMWFDADRRVTDGGTRYRPFAETPPWLDALRRALRPRPSPPAGNS